MAFVLQAVLFSAVLVIHSEKGDLRPLLLLASMPAQLIKQLLFVLELLLRLLRYLFNFRTFARSDALDLNAGPLVLHADFDHF